MNLSKVSYSKAISWIDDCRIPFVDETENTKRSISGHQKVYGSGEEIYYKFNIENQTDRNKGRFPANILVCDDALNDGSIIKNGDIKPHKQKRKTCYFTSENIISSFKSDKGTNSRYYNLDKWFEKLLSES